MADVHGHVSVPFGANSLLMLMMGLNTPMASPIGQEKAGPAGVTVHDFHEAAIKQRGVPRMLFGTEAPGSGRAVRPETGRTSDDLVPVIETFDFLSEDDKIKIFNENPARVIPALGKIR